MSQELRGRAVDILLVEDNPGDVLLTREALKDAKVYNNLYVVKDGEAALDFLYRRPPYQQAPRPDIILLDLNLPKVHGRDVLAQVKQDKSLMQIPVVVLTSSSCEEDILKAYHLNANCYITKPVDLDQFLKVVRTIENFWLAVVMLPPRD